MDLGYYYFFFLIVGMSYTEMLFGNYAILNPA